MTVKPVRFAFTFIVVASYGAPGHLHLDLQQFITFCVSRRRRKMYCGHERLCVSLSPAVRPHYCTDPDVTWRRVGEW